MPLWLLTQLLAVPASHLPRLALFGLCLLTLAPALVRAQEGGPPLLVRYGTEDGLSSSLVTAVERDALGFLWVGTLNGLCRVEGTTFTCYQHNPTDPSSLAHDLVTPEGLELDTSGRLWVTTSRGLQYFDATTGRFVTHPSFRGTLVYTMTEAPEDDLWVGTARGLYRARSLDQEAEHVWDEAPVYTLDAARDGTLWVGSNHGLWRHPPGGAFEHVEGPRTAVMAFHPLPDGSGLVGFEEDGIWQVTAQGRMSPRTLPDAAHRVVSLSSASDGSVWVGTWWNGLYRVAAAQDTVLQHLRPQPGVVGALPNISVADVLDDPELGTWIATWDGLVRLLPPSPYLSLEPRFGTDPYVMAIDEQTDSTLWVGTLGGIHRVNARTGRWTTIPGTEGWAVRALTQDRQGNLWVGTEQHGVQHWDAQTGELTGRFSEVLPAANGMVLSVHLAPDGKLWVGTGRYGLCVVPVQPFSGDPEDVTCVDTQGPPGRALAVNEVYTLEEDRDGSMLVGTSGGGVARVDKNLRVHPLSPQAAADPRLRAARVVSVLPDPVGGVWVGTFNGAAYVAPSGTVQWYGVADGLPHPSLGCLLLGEDEQVWASTGAGLAVFKEGRWVQRGRSEQFVTSSFTMGACAQASIGLWFGTRRGIVGFDPVAVPLAPEAPAVAFTRLERDGTEVLPAPTSQTALTLHPDDDRLSVHLVSRAHPHPDAVQFEYRLDPARSRPDTAWAALDGPSLLLANMAPGDYTLRARAIGATEVAKEARLTLTVLAPFWQRGWVRVLGLLSLLVVATGVYRYHLHRALEVERTRRRIADDLHDDFGSRIGGLATQLILASTRVPAEHKADLRGYGHRTQLLASDLRDLVWVVDAVRDSVEALAERVRGTAHDLLTDVDVEVEATGTVAHALPMTVRRHVLFICKEACHNIAKHAEATVVRIRLEAEAGWLRVCVEDNGRGMPANATTASHGHGLASMRRRADDLGTALVTTPSALGGVRHYLEVPLQARGRRYRTWYRRLRTLFVRRQNPTPQPPDSLDDVFPGDGYPGPAPPTAPHASVPDHVQNSGLPG
ncbi:MAG: two-component regulator propeller domain-containing protein [Bacteroidota bacterium]